MMNGGLLTFTNEPVPLKSIEVDLQVQGHIATVTSNMLYVNEEENPLEALFVFPMPSEAALCHFSARIADEEIVAEVQERQMARELYDDTLSSGQQAFILEESEESTDVFRMSIGALPPSQSVTITFIYIIELSVQADHSLRFCLPAVLNPRYSPAGSVGGIVSEITSSSGCVPYTLSFTAHLSSPNPISKVETNCSHEPLEFLNTDHTKAKFSLSAGHKFDRDVELFLFYQNPHQLTAIVEAGDPTAQPGTLMGDPVVMLSFYPEFPQSVMSSVTSRGEFLFLIDRSSSMNSHMNKIKGAKQLIESAKDTLLLLLKSLPMDCYFNIIGFGTTYESFFQKSVQYSEDTLQKAVEKVKQIEADMGGTAILRPLKHIYSQPCISNHPRQLFIFTDGEVENTREVLQCVRNNAESHRCFSFGIGEGASTALVEGLAENSSGYPQFIMGTERMQAKVMQSLRFALQPAVVDVQMVWSGVSSTHLSPPIQSLFYGQRALIYAQLKQEECQNPDGMGKISVHYRLEDQQVTNTAEFSLKPDENNGLTIHRLGARSLIRSLEKQEEDVGADKEALKARVVELSTQSGVSSSHTAFIAIHSGRGEPVKRPLVTRSIHTVNKYEEVFAWMRCGDITTMDCHLTYHNDSTLSARLYHDLQLRCNLASLNTSDLSSQHWKRKGQRFFSGILGALAPISSLFHRNKSSPTVEIDGACASGLSTVETDGATSGSCEFQDEAVLQLVSLQKALGCWDMNPKLAEVFKKTEDELIKQIPAEVDSGVWATLLALIWLHGFKMEDQVEWQFVSVKAVAWIHTQNVDNLTECIKAGNDLLGCEVTKDALGL